MHDPTTDDADLLFQEAQSESEADHELTAAALFGQAAEAYLACGNQALAALSLRNRAGELRAAGDHPAGASAAAEAALLAGRAEDLRLRVSCLWLRADCLARLLEWQTVAELAGEAVPLMREYDFQDHHGDMLLLRARAEHALGDPQSGLATAALARDVFHGRGVIRGQVWSEDFAVDMLLDLDRLEDALAKTRRNVEIARSSTGPATVAYYLQRRGMVLMLAGRPRDARRELAEARELYLEADRPGSAGLASSLLARALAALGSHQEAEELLRSAEAVLDALGPEWAQERAEAMEGLAELLYEVGRFEKAARTARDLLAVPAMDASDRAGHVELLVGSLVHAGRAEDAVRELQSLPVGDPGDEPYAFSVAACAAWAAWRTDAQLAATEEACVLLEHPGLRPATVPEAWLLHIAGTAADPGDLRGTARLARAAAIYQQQDETTLLAEVTALLLQRTA